MRVLLARVRTLVLSIGRFDAIGVAIVRKRTAAVIIWNVVRDSCSCRSSCSCFRVTFCSRSSRSLLVGRRL